MTADRCLLSWFKKFRGTLVIEEASQLPHYIWSQLASLTHLGEVRFIILGWSAGGEAASAQGTWLA